MIRCFSLYFSFFRTKQLFQKVIDTWISSGNSGWLRPYFCTIFTYITHCTYWHTISQCVSNELCWLSFWYCLIIQQTNIITLTSWCTKCCSKVVQLHSCPKFQLKSEILKLCVFKSKYAFTDDTYQHVCSDLMEYTRCTRCNMSGSVSQHRLSEGRKPVSSLSDFILYNVAPSFFHQALILKGGHHTHTHTHTHAESNI